MAEGPEQSSTNQAAIVLGFTLVIGGIVSLWLAAANRLGFLPVLLAFAFGGGLGWVVERVLLRSATSLVGNIYSAGNIPPEPTYPVADTYVVRGRFAEAAEYYRNHLAAQGWDYEARLRLADLDVVHTGNYEEAERLYKEVRDAREDKRREVRAFNGLIDLYSKLGRKDRLKVELSRFADRYAGSSHAEDARRRLDELKSEA
ncbi:MAG TPA: tetratricopeptide repeat protein [Gemmatimonadales bacterium]|nr:tetratricopeptide repeat protein [Gemmatimonadales bacterium]